MKKKLDRSKILKHSRLLEVLDYNPKTGHFYWKVMLSPTGPIGSRAGYKRKKYPYIIITIDKVLYYAHILAWFYVKKKYPKFEIDHKNQIKHHNWIKNLRKADRSGNNSNISKVRKDSSTGIKGVFGEEGGYWSKIFHKGKQHYLGSFSTADQAQKAYIAAHKRLKGKWSPYQ